MRPEKSEMLTALDRGIVARPDRAKSAQHAHCSPVRLRNRPIEGKLVVPKFEHRGLENTEHYEALGLELARSYNPLRGCPLTRTWIRPPRALANLVAR